MKSTAFVRAVPVWAEGLETERNVSICLTREIGRGGALLRISAHSVYQAYLNGELIADGPARAAHGLYRVDEIDLTEKLIYESNRLEIIVAGYNISSYYLLNAPSFVCAEVIEDGTVSAATGFGGFDARFYTERVSKVQRYSYQRPFAEVYSMPGGYKKAVLAPTCEKRFITREVPYPKYDREYLKDVISGWKFDIAEPDPLGYCKENYTPFVRITGGNYSFELDELEIFSEREAKRLKYSPAELPEGAGTGSVRIPRNGAFIGDFGRELTGFISFDIETSGGRLFVTFDEVLRENDVDFTRMDTTNCVIYDLMPGKYSITCFEPYSLRYIKFSSCAENAAVSGISVAKFEFGGEIRPAPVINDETARRIYDAAVATFMQNTLDIYMDCPSRERAGWLCDSFFTSRSEFELTGRSTVEHAFLDNFVMAENPQMPHGMLPACYPSDHEDHGYIPNWAMWYGIELKDYFGRTGDRELIADARKSMYDLLDFFRGYENSDGLLEKLDSWVFVEWSHANDLVQDINYPTNMLYSLFVRSVGELYGDPALVEKADRIAETVREQSFVNGWFCDNAVYGDDGIARLSGESTETCQYYAFFTGVATKETYPELWDRMLNGFGPQRKEKNGYPDIAFANAFIGNYLRLELIFRAGLYDKLLEEIKGYFGYMALKTGTLWENDGDYASCNHGFASYVLVWLRRIFE